MFRKMIRARQLLSMDDTIAVLNRCTNGVLACSGDADYPYAVPLSYVYYDHKIYFHCAKSGHKIDAFTKNPKVSFAVVDQDTIVSEEYTSYFRSVILFGKARITEGDEWFRGFEALVEKYSGDRPSDEKEKEITDCKRSHIIAIDIEHLTGKEAKELVKAKKK
ncbi:MAG: pyridoxamine 5'-phosphate oxidase family protein [Firmicutes bacterium]|nr:pyridoxamine 5'-phosphate oxidase family protein [Bacillota bacterium]